MGRPFKFQRCVEKIRGRRIIFDNIFQTFHTLTVGDHFGGVF